MNESLIPDIPIWYVSFYFFLIFYNIYFLTRPHVKHFLCKYIAFSVYFLVDLDISIN